MEILVKVSVSQGRIKRDSLTIEKIKMNAHKHSWKWESEEYRRLKKVVPHRLRIDVIRKVGLGSSIVKLMIDDQAIRFAKSPDRLKLLYVLAEQARADYLSQSANEGWVSALELTHSVWQISLKNGVTEIPGEIRREIANSIITWARHLEKQGKLKLDAGRNVDHDYVNSEILVLDVQLKKKIADLVYLINHDERCKFGSEFKLIESQAGLGYRISLHPALIFITRTEEGA